MANDFMSEVPLNSSLHNGQGKTERLYILWEGRCTGRGKYEVLSVHGTIITIKAPNITVESMYIDVPLCTSITLCCLFLDLLNTSTGIGPFRGQWHRNQQKSLKTCLGKEGKET